MNPETALYPMQTGKFAIVTGTGGLGLEAAKALARHGLSVIVAGRNPDHGQAAISEINQGATGGPARFDLLDLADLGSVRAFADRMLGNGQAINILINNAGIMSPPNRTVTKEGFEAQFGINHLGHFALTARLLPLLQKSEAARVVHVTSLAHRYGQINFDDLQCEKSYKAGLAYCQSKLAVALFARSLQAVADLNGWPITSIAVHPGFAGTNLIAAGHGARSLLSRVSNKVIVPLFGQSAAAGALPLIHATLDAAIEGGKLYGPSGFMEMKGPVRECQFAATALDDAVAQRLWSISEQLCAVEFSTT